MRQHITELIKGYYSKTEIELPRLEQREFGFGTFDAKIATRHIAFESKQKLKDYLIRNAPPFSSCSPAFYRFPSARPMEKKEFLGSELVFDLDATDMKLDCQLVHGTKWVCSNCIEKVREETVKLIEQFLIPDFGFSEKEIEVNFSGNRGFHIHIGAERILSLDSKQRKEITDYIGGIGIDFEKFFPTAGIRGFKLMGPKPTDPGWGGKIARNAIRAMDNGVEEIMKLGIDKPTASRMFRNKALIELGIRNGNWDMVYIKKKDEIWSNLMKSQAVVQADKIDKNVTCDTSHILRIANTIHGETGLIAKKLSSVKELADYDPMKKCIAFNEGEIEMKIGKCEKFSMNGLEFGPFNEQKATLPTYAAVYLYLKGIAEPVNDV